jgi:hypothetical protein
MTPAVIGFVPIVKIISSSVIASGKLATVSTARAAGVAMKTLWVDIADAVVVVTSPVVKVAVPIASVALAPTGVVLAMP